ncbi:MAG TPA: response regulator, partial [Phycisphaerae bacterium]|nr:response regulator [Phycisphaerae bacterium]
HGWTHIIADIATWGAYTTIPFVLAYLVIRRKDLPFPRIFWLFAAFIFTCGTVHLIEATIFWWPIYRVSAIAKVATAVASWATVIAILQVAPRALAAPGLAKMNEDLSREIAERRRAEAMLRENQERLRFILQATGVGTWDWDVPTGRVLWSDTLESIHGLPPGGFGQTFEAFMAAVHPDDREMLERTIHRALREGTDYAVEYRANCRTDKICWLEMKGHILARDENGQARRVVGTCSDITVRKQAEMRFRLTVEASPNVVLLVDRQGKIVLVNSRVTSMFGYEPAELIGQPVEKLVPERFREKHPIYREEFNRHPQARPMGAGRDLYALRKDGTEFPVEIGLSPTESEEGMLVLATIVDITSRKQSEQERLQLLEAERAARNEAERANRLKDMFLATVSHELRTPLNAILGWSQMLTRAGLQGEAAQATEIIQRNAKVQARLIEDLLDMSRIISGKIRLEMQNIELPIVVNSAIEAVVPAAQVKNIELVRNVDAHVGPTRGDPNRLQQVVWNLLTNAIKFTPKGGKVSISLRRSGSSVEIVVADTGIGIRPEFLPFMFDRFRQADSSVGRAHTGLGLGLSIVKNLVELHGGTVQAHSDGEGRGTTFTVRLPVAPIVQDSDAESDPMPSTDLTRVRMPPGGPQAFNGLRILVVDDDPDACSLAQRVLEDCGAKIATANSADEALELYESFRPDLIISDISMPGKDGYQFIQEIREREAGQMHSTPAAALTALTRPEDRARAVLSGYQAHLSKPLTAAELISVVGTLTGRPRDSRRAMPAPEAQIGDEARRADPHTETASAVMPAPGTHVAARLLVVEDNRDVAEMIEVFLEKQGFEVLTVHSIAQALEMFETRPFDLVISDVGLPDGSGISLIRQLRARRPIKGVALSGHASEALINLCKRAGFSEYLVKPAEEEDLFRAIQRVLAGPDAT